MTVSTALRSTAFAAALVLASAPLAAQTDDPAETTSQDVRTEISEAMDAIADYSAQERDEALNEAREAMERLDAEIEQRAQALRSSWNDMSESARESASEQLEALRTARNRLGERYGALEAGAADAWGELTAGFSRAWNDLSEAWKAVDETAEDSAERDI